MLPQNMFNFMKEADLYWVIYKNLEAETISLAKQVAFTSDQKKVYSMAIADLIVRCAIEIESLSKKLYGSLGGDTGKKNPKFDSDCLDFLENKYKLSKKEVLLCSPFFSFNENDCIINPLAEANKIGKSGCLWKQAYNALKHDRYVSLKEYGNVWNLINAMGALYLLNLYFKDVVYSLENSTDSFDARVDSDIFSIMVFDATINIVVSTDLLDDRCIDIKNEIDKDRATYIIRFTDKSRSALKEASEKDFNETAQKTLKNPKVKEYLLAHPTEGEISLPKLIIGALGKEEFQEHYVISNSLRLYVTGKREAVLNKNTTIYPPISDLKQ